MNTPKELNARDTTPVSVRREYEKPEVMFETPLEAMADVCLEPMGKATAPAPCSSAYS